jgi:hypothetical protein
LREIFRSNAVSAFAQFLVVIISAPVLHPICRAWEDALLEAAENPRAFDALLDELERECDRVEDWLRRTCAAGGLN